MNTVEQEIKKNILDGLRNFLHDLEESRFFGTVEIQFVDGNIAIIRKEETFKPVIFLSR